MSLSISYRLLIGFIYPFINKEIVQNEFRVIRQTSNT